MSMMRSSFRESASTSTDSDRRTVIVERLNGSFGFTLQSYGIHYRQEADLEIVTYVDFVDPIGHAHKAGLRSGDVIVSINGQDVERADHATLVSIIQSCPDRIRMVVVYENCVRKVELHMKYIRLTQMLEAKAREYQEVCAREKSFISRLDKTRGPGPYYTMHNPSQGVIRRDPAPSSTAPGSYSSKSLPRNQNQTEFVGGGSPTASGSSSHTGPHCGGNKRRSYLCIGRPSDCDCCFRPEGYKMSASGSIRSKQQQQQRPRSVHLSCYKDPNAFSPDERYLIRPSDRNPSCKVYGGYGFGYEYSSVKGHPISATPPIHPAVEHQQHYGRYQPPPPHKSADDLLLAAQFKNQCRVSNSPHHQPQFQEISRLGSRPQQPRPQHQQQQQTLPAPNLDSIVFYTRPPQPSIHPAVRMTSSVSGSHIHQQQPHSRSFYQPPPKQLHSPANDDEGGFNEARRFRTLPAATSQKSSDFRT